MPDQDENRPFMLRYAVEYNIDGQVHTVEMTIPLPSGASADQREQLFREAKAGMNQLISHMGLQEPPAMPHGQAAQRELAAQAQPQPASLPRAAAPERSISRPAAVAAPLPAQQSTAAVAAVREARPAPVRQEVAVPPTRPNIGATMPATHGPTLDSSGNMLLPDFIRYIKENLGLSPKDAMNRLGVKTLNGVNLREALEHLYRQEPDAAAAANVQASQPEDSYTAYVQHEQAAPVYELATQPPVHLREQWQAEVEESAHEPVEMRVAQPGRGFDEEEVDGEDGLQDLSDLDLPQEFTTEQLERAHDKIKELRESQGATVASPSRLKVLNNVAISQVTEEQLEEMVQGVWNIALLKKLKMDQVEAIISWAKQDYFVEEIEAVLAALEEERYARGNR